MPAAISPFPPRPPVPSSLPPLPPSYLAAAGASAMAFLRPPPPLYLRLLARRLLSGPPLPHRLLSFSSLITPLRIRFAASLSGMIIRRNPVAFMSTSTTTIPSESAMEKTADSSAYGSEQIQLSRQQSTSAYLKKVKRSHFISSDKVVNLGDEVESIFMKQFASSDRKP